MQTQDASFQILVVDDDADLSSNLSDILEAEGFNVRVARDGKTALKFGSKQNFGLALVDMRLPDMPGIDLAEAFHRISPTTDYVIITGYASLESAVEAVRQKNILAYETKPVNIDRLLALIRQIAERRRLEREVLGVTEEERQRFGRELHDGLGQLLTGAALHAKFLADLINQAITESSRLARGLAPISLETKGLVAALEELVWQVAQTSGVECSLEIDPRLSLPEKPLAIHLYRIIQEALQNAVKHSKASQIQVRLKPDNGGGFLEVTDNGQGMREREKNKDGMGVKIMNYRAGLLGGILEMDSNPEYGTRIRLCFRPGTT